MTSITTKNVEKERQLTTLLHLQGNFISPPHTPKGAHCKLQSSPKSCQDGEDILPKLRSNEEMSNAAILKLRPHNFWTPPPKKRCYSKSTLFLTNDLISSPPSAPRQRRCVLQSHIELPLSRIHEQLLIPKLKKEDEKEERIKHIPLQLKPRFNEFSPMYSSFLTFPLIKERLVLPIKSPERRQQYADELQLPQIFSTLKK